MMEKRKTVGIITMHRVINCGSALQAYALQRVIQEMGFDAEIIDYIYPNQYHKKKYKINGIKGYIKELYRIGQRVWNKMNFKRFYDNFFVLSKISYKTKEDLSKNVPVYDIYVSGSDQVWNPKTIDFDTSYMLSWVKVGKKIAYSGSFASSVIPEKYKAVYSKALSDYDYLSVREKHSLNILKELSGKSAEFVLDPTLLLDAKSWDRVVNDADVDIKEDYILVYLLGYSFNIYPYASDLINHVSEKYNKKVVVLSMSNIFINKLNNKTVIRRLSPQNFLSLIAKASLVITDSFHATAMSLNFGVPMYSLIKDKKSEDNRVYSILLSMKAEDRAIEKGASFDNLPPITMDYTTIKETLADIRNNSLHYLKTALIG